MAQMIVGAAIAFVGVFLGYAIAKTAMEDKL